MLNFQSLNRKDSEMPSSAPLPWHKAVNTLSDIFVYSWLKVCSDIASMALLCSLMYHLIVLLVRVFFILSNTFGCEYISICHDHSEHRGLLLFFPLFNTGRLLPTELLEYCFHALQCFLSLSPPLSPPPQQTNLCFLIECIFTFLNHVFSTIVSPVYLHLSYSLVFQNWTQGWV